MLVWPARPLAVACYLVAPTGAGLFALYVLAAAFRAQEQFDLAHGLRTSEERELQRWRHIVAAVLDDVSDPEDCFAELHAHFARPGSWRCEPGVAEVLRALRTAGYRVGLASN